ncbi:MAG TPA: Rne/Rng family ribonuclease [Candidatus Polarisedimenticolia bacterium]|nr:Rne/Rng family ribonuclease [Candidatus Polarisedimenticolia bacterium]
MKHELIINAGPQETRIALLEDGLPVEVFLERSSAPSILGNVYKGRVSNVLPGMQSAFVDLGLDRDAFLYVTDLLPSEQAPGDPEPGSAEGERPGGRASRRGPAIESLLQAGQEILVQVTKEALGSKGPRVSTQIALPGRLLVFLPAGTCRSVSRRITSDEEGGRLVELVKNLPGTGGFIARTAAAGIDSAALEREARQLRLYWEDLRRSAEAAPVPSCLHRQAGLVLKILRDLASSDLERIVVDDDATLRRCREWVEELLPVTGPAVQSHGGTEEIFEAFGIERELEKALRRRVWLPSGGFLFIQPTEALVAIDVNTGKFVGERRFEETALKTNLEAAREAVRQIRLRDLGGILVIDFIDLEEEESRRALAGALEEALKSDRARSRMLQMSDFGLVQITRQRLRKGLEGLLCRSCPTCRGTGRVKNAETVRFQIQRELKKMVPLLERGIVIRAHPEVAGLMDADRALLSRATGLSPAHEVRIEAVAGFHPEEFEIRGA